MKNNVEQKQKSDIALREEAILKFWEENKIFEKSLAHRKDSPLYSFYDGPPFATGTPHYGHIAASAIKDVVPRYWAMRGYRVDRKWGWDCHGLPIENIAEKELGITEKKEIVKMGVEKFNEFCRSKVLKYVDEWKVVIRRLGRWADMENSYKTMDLDFMESVWWVFKELWDKGFIYEGYRSMHICTRCETTLSQTEVVEGYKDIKDLSAIVKFKLNLGQKIGDFEALDNTYILAWTTTPWTLIGNVALAVGEEIEYIQFIIKKIKKNTTKLNLKEGEQYIISLNNFDKVFSFLYKGIFDTEGDVNIHSDTEKGIIEIIVNKTYKKKGKELVGLEYKPLFSYYSGKGLQNEENGWKIYAGDFVTTEEGTGIVHIAPAFGDDDMKLGQKYKLPFIQHVGIDGVIREEAGEFAGLSVKPKSSDVSVKDAHQKTDIEIIKYLAHNNFLFFKEKYEHSYPHCWRCDTPLINYATSSWFVNVLKVKARALELAKEINWSPKYLKEGRFGKWLEGARDWSISRQRFWASVIPIWKCQECGEMRVFGVVKDLEEVSGQKITDLHKHVVDKIIFKCAKCSGEMRRVPDVLDTWFDSGSMPYAQSHYPFTNKEKFDKGFPADFIAEGVDQTRAWFYYLHVIATAIKDKPAFKNVIVEGMVLAEDGKKMAKRLKNYPDPVLMFDKYGADALRFYLLSSPVASAETINFKEGDVAELSRGMFRMLWNSYLFFQTYASKNNENPSQPPFAKGGEKLSSSLQKREIQESPLLQRGLGGFSVTSLNLLDKWIVSELNILTKQINEGMEKYELVKTVRAFPKFIDNFSNWYIRRSRERFAKPENDPDRISAEQTMRNCLVTLAKLLAPFTPFVAEEIYKNLTNEESVHFADYPEFQSFDENDPVLCDLMAQVRQIVTLGLAVRAKAKIKVRQPLQKLKVKSEKFLFIANSFTILSAEKVSNELQELIKDELNIKEILFVDELKEEDGWVLETDGKITVALDTKITDELKEEGVVRDIARHIQTMRKDLGLTKEDWIEVIAEKSGAVAKIFANDKWEKFIKEKTITKNISDYQAGEKYDMEKDLEIEGVKIKIGVKKVK